MYRRSSGEKPVGHLFAYHNRLTIRASTMIFVNVTFNPYTPLAPSVIYNLQKYNTLNE